MNLWQFFKQNGQRRISDVISFSVQSQTNKHTIILKAQHESVAAFTLLLIPYIFIRFLSYLQGGYTLTNSWQYQNPEVSWFLIFQLLL